MSQNSLVEIERELSRVKEELKQLDNDFATTKNRLLDEIRRQTSTSIQTTLELVHQMNVQTMVYTRKKTEIELKLITNRETYFKKLQE